VLVLPEPWEGLFSSFLGLVSWCRVPVPTCSFCFGCLGDVFCADPGAGAGAGGCGLSLTLVGPDWLGGVGCGVETCASGEDPWGFGVDFCGLGAGSSFLDVGPCGLGVATCGLSVGSCDCGGGVGLTPPIAVELLGTEDLPEAADGFVGFVPWGFSVLVFRPLDDGSLATCGFVIGVAPGGFSVFGLKTFGLTAADEPAEESVTGPDSGPDDIMLAGLVFVAFVPVDADFVLS
jgi:hypothetical protein